MKPAMFLIINSLYGGGAEHVAARLSQEWGKKYNLFIISLADQTDKDYNFCGQIISIADSHYGKTWLGRIKNAARKIDELALKYSPLIMVSFLQNSNLCLMMTHYESKKIVSIRNYIRSQYSGMKLYLWELMIRLYFSKADYVVSVSKKINSEMTDRYRISRNKCKRIYNPYDLEKIREESKEELNTSEKEFFSNHIVISNMGHISCQKGQYHIIRILRELRKTNDRMGVVIIGDDQGKYADKIRELAKECGVLEHVLFTGHKKNPYKYLVNSFCFLFPSLYEGFPNALIEAMACGIPVIASDCNSGPREIIEPDEMNKYGFLIMDDQTEWIQASDILTCQENQAINKIRILLENEEERKKYARKAITRASDFEMDKILCQWDEIM